MQQYYYTVASLPAVRFEEKPFLARDEFLEICRIEATPDDQDVIENARIFPELQEDEAPQPMPGVLGRWNELVREFSVGAAQIRAQNLGWDSERLPRAAGLDAAMAERTRTVLNEETPLKMEIALMRWLWQVVEDLETGHHFDREKLVVYHLKLQLALRRAHLTDAEAGGEEYDRQYETVAHSLMEITK